MNSYLLNRALGSVAPNEFHTAQTERLVRNLEPAPGIRFSSRKAVPDQSEDDTTLNPDFDPTEKLYAHKSGVNCLAIDQFEGRYMISGGADPSIHLWDLESRGSELEHIHRACASVSKPSHSAAHTHAITSLSIYPFDPVPSTIFSTAHDGTLKWSALQSPRDHTPPHLQPRLHTLRPFILLRPSLNAPTRRRDLGPIGHNAPVLSVAWAPHKPYLLASGSVDNRVIIFDVRKGGHNSAIATLDMDDPVGLSKSGISAEFLHGPRGLFTDCARTQWARYRPERAPVLVPKGFMTPGHETLLWPNFNEQDDRGEIFMFELREGTFVKRLKLPGVAMSQSQVRGRASALSAARITDLVWRGNGASGEGVELFSAHGDGTIRSWVSREEDGELDEEEEAAEATRKRKRDVLDDIYKGFLGAEEARSFT
ncbi:hypothetical protein N7533_013789 [Penicillium manginii]|uniref:uncharacterized protein n=1 Tax=Penicillium manginii TaxID=203109 RepID=UPI00254968F5|nr:uncharacterized protein N7533_013789 [Penicillium manginii]KAJ5733342.1 hypothetical protein N7533_013789 [Penicillium manginii]